MKKRTISLDLYSKVQHYLNYKGLLNPCEWLQYIIYMYFVYVYVCVCSDGRVCIYMCTCRYIHTHIYVRMFCKSFVSFEHLWCTNVSHGCGYECMFCGTKWKVDARFTPEESIGRESEREETRAWVRGEREKKDEINRERNREDELKTYNSWIENS